MPIGFDINKTRGNKKTKEIRKTDLDIYDLFIGKPGHYAVGSVSTMGVLKEINFSQKYLAVQPSIVGYGEKGLRIEKKLPTVITLTPGSPISMRPLKEGDLKKIVEERRKPPVSYVMIECLKIYGKNKATHNYCLWTCRPRKNIYFR